MFKWKDMSYIKDMFIVKYGYAKVDVHGLRLECCNSDIIRKTFSGKTFLRGYSRNVTHEEMEQRIKAVCDAVNEKFKVYQYTDEVSVPYKSKWDLFFWCNHKSNTTGGKERGRDYSYVTLGFNDHGMTYEERRQVCTEIVAFIGTLGIDIDVAIQYDLLYDNEHIQATVRTFCENCCSVKNPEFIEYGGQLGRIRKLDNGSFGFFKKGARSRGYSIDPSDTEILHLAILSNSGNSEEKMTG